MVIKTEPVSWPGAAHPSDRAHHRFLGWSRGDIRGLKLKQRGLRGKPAQSFSAMRSTQTAAMRALLMTAAMLASVAADGSASGSDRGIDVVTSSSKQQAASLTLLITGAVGLALCVVFSIMFYSLGVVMRLVDPEGELHHPR